MKWNHWMSVREICLYLWSRLILPINTPCLLMKTHRLEFLNGSFLAACNQGPCIVLETHDLDKWRKVFVESSYEETEFLILGQIKNKLAYVKSAYALCSHKLVDVHSEKQFNSTIDSYYLWNSKLKYLIPDFKIAVVSQHYWGRSHRTSSCIPSALFFIIIVGRLFI